MQHEQNVYCFSSILFDKLLTMSLANERHLTSEQFDFQTQFQKFSATLFYNLVPQAFGRC